MTKSIHDFVVRINLDYNKWNSEADDKHSGQNIGATLLPVSYIMTDGGEYLHGIFQTARENY